MTQTDYKQWAKDLGKQCAIALEKIWAEAIANANASELISQWNECYWGYLHEYIDNTITKVDIDDLEYD